MKASELRIGNWVVYSSLMQVNGYKIAECEDHPSRFGSIQLTEEWLLKFGFESNPYKDTYEKRYVVINCDKTKGYLQLWLDALPVDLKYVHQLQNLYFALTGEELTIKKDK